METDYLLSFEDCQYNYLKYKGVQTSIALLVITGAIVTDQQGKGAWNDED